MSILITTQLPPKLDALATLLNAQPGPVQVVFQYSLALLMVEGGKTTLIGPEPGENGPICTFKTVAGDVFNLSRPPLSDADEVAVKEILREILEKEQFL